VQKEPKSLQPEHLLVSKYGKNALAAAPSPAGGGSLQCSPRPLAGFWEGKMGKRKGGEEMSERRERGGGTKRRGRGIGGKEEEGTLLISFAPQPLNLSDAAG